MDYVYAKQSAGAGGGGRIWQVEKGTVWPADHPVVQEHPGLFSDTPTVVYPTKKSAEQIGVEQATAAPGEKRTKK